jgi:hypothetical protein
VAVVSDSGMTAQMSKLLDTMCRTAPGLVIILLQFATTCNCQLADNCPNQPPGQKNAIAQSYNYTRHSLL